MPKNEMLELLLQATVRLSGDGPIKDRLADAFSMHLAQMDGEELPSELKVEFDVMRQAMQRERPLPKESVARASVRKMSLDEARGYAELVVHMFGALARDAVTQVSNRRTARANRPSSVVPFYAMEAGDIATGTRA